MNLKQRRAAKFAVDAVPSKYVGVKPEKIDLLSTVLRCMEPKPLATFDAQVVPRSHLGEQELHYVLANLQGALRLPLPQVDPAPIENLPPPTVEDLPAVVVPAHFIDFAALLANNPTRP